VIFRQVGWFRAVIGVGMGGWMGCTKGRGGARAYIT